MIAIVDYGRGNLGSVEQAFVRLGMPAVVTQDARAVDEADAVVLPGDGAFHDAMANLEALGLLAAARRAVDGTRPFLGICLGYQLLFSTSEEFGEGRGLDVIPGAVRRFPAGRKVPHMGWNRLEHAGELRLLEGIPSGAHFYFVHSYFPVIAANTGPFVAGSARPQLTWVGSERTGCVEAAADNPSGGVEAPADTPFRGVEAAPDNPSGVSGSADAVRIAWCEYGVRFAAAVERGLLMATQFHPEKSQRWGLRLLENFAALVKERAT